MVGILAEGTSVWERRVPLTPAHCAWLLSGNKKTLWTLLFKRKMSSGNVTRIIVQPSTKRIYHDALYEAAGCEISQDLSDCSLILGVKQPEVTVLS